MQQTPAPGGVTASIHESTTACPRELPLAIILTRMTHDQGHSRDLHTPHLGWVPGVLGQRSPTCTVRTACSHGCEETWVMDHENLPIRGEYSPHEAAQLARAVEEVHESDREAFMAWVLSGDQIEDGDGLPSVSDFEERYCGTPTIVPRLHRRHRPARRHPRLQLARRGRCPSPVVLNATQNASRAG